MKKWILSVAFSVSLLATTLSQAETLPQTRIKPSPNCLALTFDDGPNPVETPAILAILKKYNIKATFFMMGGFAKKYPELVKMVYEDGHSVQNHTWTHPMLARVSPKELERQIQKTNDVIVQTIGKKPICVRPPFGNSNQRVRDYIHSQGMQVVMWDLNSFDYERKGVQKMVDWVLNNTKHGGDVLMHDGGNSRGQTVKALPLIIEGAMKRGQCFEVLCQ